MFTTRTNEFLIEKSLLSRYVTAILGPRQVGKTTLIQHYAQDHPEYNWVFLNMDDLFVRQRAQSGELKNLIEEGALRKITADKLLRVVIDEAQKCPEAFDQIKIIYDQYKEQNAIKFILTGSGQLSLHKLSAESLAGRIQLYYLREFNLREGLHLQKNITIENNSIFNLIDQNNFNFQELNNYIEELSPYRAALEESISFQLVWGGLPEIFSQQDNEMRIKYLADYLQTYLEKDVRAITTITDLPLYQKLMEIVAEQTGSLRDDTRILQALSCSRDTLKKYRGYLEATLFYQELFPYINHSLKRLVKSPKAYLIDNGLISVLTGIYDWNTLVRTGMIGHRFENWLLKELRIWLDRHPGRTHIYYWRTSGNIEVDFVVEKKPEIYPFEITYSKQIDKKKLKNLNVFLAEEPRAKFGFYIYNGKFHFDAEARIFFLPAWMIG